MRCFPSRFIPPRRRTVQDGEPLGGIGISPGPSGRSRDTRPTATSSANFSAGNSTRSPAAWNLPSALKGSTAYPTSDEDGAFSGFAAGADASFAGALLLLSSAITPPR